MQDKHSHAPLAEAELGLVLTPNSKLLTIPLKSTAENSSPGTDASVILSYRRHVQPTETLTPVS